MPGFADNIGDVYDLPWVSQPIVTFPTVQTTAVKIASADPKRVTLVISGNDSQAHYIAPTPTVAQRQGITLPQADPFIIFTQFEHGLLVTLEWWAICSAVGANVMCVITQSLSDWPSADRDSLLKKVDNGLFRGFIAGRKNGSSRAKLYSDSWGKRETGKGYYLPDFGNPGIR